MKRGVLLTQFLAPTAEATGRVRDLVFYSGAAVLRYDWWTDEQYTLAFSMDPKDVKLGRLNDGAPLLKDHYASLDNQVGVVEKAWLDDGQAMARVRFSDRTEVDGIWQDVEAGIIQNVSMGVNIDELKDITPKGAKQKAYMAYGWEPAEISLVPIGADPGAGMLSGAPPRELLHKLYTRHLSATAGASSRNAEEQTSEAARLAFAARILRGR